MKTEMTKFGVVYTTENLDDAFTLGKLEVICKLLGAEYSIRTVTNVTPGSSGGDNIDFNLMAEPLSNLAAHLVSAVK